METIELWIEGYSCTGADADARFVGSYLADSMDQAVEMAIVQRQLNRETTRRRDDGGWSDWGCRIFNNETDARVAYG